MVSVALALLVSFCSAIDTTPDRVTVLEGRVNTVESTVSTLSQKIDATPPPANGTTTVIVQGYSDVNVTHAIADALTPVERSVATLDARVVSAEGAVAAIDERVVSTEGAVDTLDARVGSFENAVATVDQRAVSTEGAVDTLRGRMVSAEEGVAALGGRLARAEEAVQRANATAEARLATAEEAIANAGAGIAEARGAAADAAAQAAEARDVASGAAVQAADAHGAAGAAAAQAAEALARAEEAASGAGAANEAAQRAAAAAQAAADAHNVTALLEIIDNLNASIGELRSSVRRNEAAIAAASAGHGGSTNAANNHVTDGNGVGAPESADERIRRVERSLNVAVGIGYVLGIGALAAGLVYITHRRVGSGGATPPAATNDTGRPDATSSVAGDSVVSGPPPVRVRADWRGAHPHVGPSSMDHPGSMHSLSLSPERRMPDSAGGVPGASPGAVSGTAPATTWSGVFSGALDWMSRRGFTPRAGPAPGASGDLPMTEVSQDDPMNRPPDI